MSKMKELDLRKQEAVDQCNEMRRENECGFSHLYHPYNKIVEYAFMQGFHAGHAEMRMRELKGEALYDERQLHEYLESKLDEAVDAEVGEYVDTHQTKEKK